MKSTPASSNASRAFQDPSSGFSLVELLAVIAIISLVATIATPSISPILQARSSAVALDTASNIATVARQTAMSMAKPVAMVVTRQPDSGIKDDQGVLLMVFDGTDASGQNKWKPVGSWNRISPVVRVEVYDREGAASFYSGDGGGSISGNLPLKFSGKDPSYDYVVFQPDGSLDAPKSGPALTFRRLNNDAPDYSLVLQNDSGRVKSFQN